MAVGDAKEESLSREWRGLQGPLYCLWLVKCSPELRETLLELLLVFIKVPYLMLRQHELRVETKQISEDRYR